MKAALSTQFPSELLLKGMVASEVREIESSLEEKVLSVRCSATVSHFEAGCVDLGCMRWSHRLSIECRKECINDTGVMNVVCHH